MTITDFTPGDIMAFHPLPDLVFTPPRRWAAPDGALARVLGVDPTFGYGLVLVEWLDRSHGQNDDGYQPGDFEPYQRQGDLLDMLEVDA